MKNSTNPQSPRLRLVNPTLRQTQRSLYFTLCLAVLQQPRERLGLRTRPPPADLLLSEARLPRADRRRGLSPGPAEKTQGSWGAGPRTPLGDCSCACALLASLSVLACILTHSAREERTNRTPGPGTLSISLADAKEVTITLGKR